MATDPGALTIGANHHGHGVPADDRLDTSLDLTVARENRLLILGNRIDVRGVGSKGNTDPLLLGPHLQQSQQLTDPIFTLSL